ncbi:hypothetical protein [Pseudonocardia nigra]|uniref:hypothetical protein n=1 Tax=Pseudonocardia nigra TaxID=1921578 RepID=UPI001C5E6E92|nr:hypothetical protein [Pseudonocardia nigra]
MSSSTCWPIASAPKRCHYFVLAADAGAARSYVFQRNPVREHSVIAAAEADSRAAQRGLWGACPA